MRSVWQVKSMVNFAQLLADEFPEEDLLFRGQEEGWPLLPKIARLVYATETVFTAEARMLQDFQRQGLPLCEVAPGRHLGLACGWPASRPTYSPPRLDTKSTSCNVVRSRAASGGTPAGCYPRRRNER
jgi:hypothetical protein